MSKGAVYVRGPDNVFYRKEKTPSISSISSESLSRRSTEVDNTLNELMTCGFRVEKTPESVEPKNIDMLGTETPRPEVHGRTLQPKARASRSRRAGTAHTPRALGPYTREWRSQVRPFMAGMLATYLLQLGLPLINYCMGALATLLKWAIVACAALGGVLVYLGAMPTMADMQLYFTRFRPGPWRGFREEQPELLDPESDEEVPRALNLDVRPPVPAKKSVPAPTKDDVTVTNVKAFQAQLRHSPHLAKTDYGRPERGGSAPALGKDRHDARVQMRRAFTEGAPAEAKGNTAARLETRRQTGHGSIYSGVHGGVHGGMQGSEPVPQVARPPRNSRASSPQVTSGPSTFSRRKSASSLSHVSTPHDDDLPFLCEMKMKDSDRFSLGRLNTTTTKQSVLGTRANYSKFLANVGD